MTKTPGKIGCYCVVVVIIMASIVSLTKTTGGRLTLGIIFGVIGLFVVVNIPHNLRIWRARKAFKSLPTTIKERVLDLIEHAAAENPSVTCLLLEDEPSLEPEISVISHVGGMPYAESGESWPASTDSVPPRFLLQVRLDEPSLGEQWQDRLIAVFLVLDTELIMRSYGGPALEKYVPIAPPVLPFRCIRLRSLAFPAATKDTPIPLSPANLCDEIPEIKEILSPFTSDCPGLLSLILRPEFMDTIWRNL